MPRRLSEYLLDDEFAEFVLDDPASFDTAVLRIIQDIELAAYTLTRDTGHDQMDAGSVERALEALGADDALERRGTAPAQLINYYGDLVRAYSLQPIPYADDAIHLVATVAASASYDLLRSAARRAAEDPTPVIRRSHLLRFCEEWPFPFNRWLC